MNYKDRDGNEYKVSTSQDRFLDFLYNTKPGRVILKGMISDKLTRLIEIYMNTRISTLKIDPFIKKNKIKISDYEKKFYKNYNDFFTRKIKKNRRPVDMREDVLVSPSDGKVTVYPISDRLVVNIKHIDYSVKSLLLDRELSEELEGGWLYVIRLTVDNYHRYIKVTKKKYEDKGVVTYSQLYPSFDRYLPENRNILMSYDEIQPILKDFFDIKDTES